MSEPHLMTPLREPPRASVEVPGSKSLTNRALVAAVLAGGSSRLEGILLADDTWAMIEGLRSLGFAIEVDEATKVAEVHGRGGTIPAESGRVDVRLSGTTARFLAPLLALGQGRYELDGDAPFRRRPMAPVLDALTALGAGVESLGEPGHLPVVIDASGWRSDGVTVAGDTSSQFLSGLLLAAPASGRGVTIELDSTLVSRPYIDLTIATMEAFGAHVLEPTQQRFVVEPSGYDAIDYAIEPDASAASYLLAAAVISGGTVRVEGLTADARQGDAGFAQVLALMGADVSIDAGGTTVSAGEHLRGIEVDLGPMSDTAQTLAAVAVFAEGPTRVTGIGFIRAKETDRIAAVVTELGRCGIRAEEEPDGFVVYPGEPTPTVISTYDDHRMAMSFALLGLRAPGIAIADPGCVSKTFPNYFEVLDRLR